PAEKRWDLDIVVPVEDMSDLGASSAPRAVTLDSEQPARAPSIWPHVENRILDVIEQHRSTIVFANSRRLAERLTSHLNELHAERLQATAEADAAAQADLDLDANGAEPDVADPDEAEDRRADVEAP
ncbi:hypothetical protein HN261_22385, partial [Acinetobacter baumannii]|nr:hypothetical protein [Acinetobacter baumannii]